MLESMKPLLALLALTLSLTACVGGTSNGAVAGVAENQGIALGVEHQPPVNNGQTEAVDLTTVQVPPSWLEGDGDELAMSTTRLEPPTVPGQVTLSGDPRRVVLGEPLLFSLGSAVIRPGADEFLRILANQIVVELQAGELLVIDGYVDEVGSSAANAELGLERADSVKARLLRLAPSLAEYRLEARGHDEGDLLHPDCRGECPLNRVVVVSVVVENAMEPGG